VNWKASKVTTGALDTALTIESGNTITVFCVIVANQNDDPASVDVEIKNGVGDVVIPVAVQPNDTVVIDTPWIADGGVSVDSLSDANVHVTVFHSQAGS
jgi:hypothetical protein